MKRFRKNQKGFTLVEIMSVVAIISMLTAMSVPNFLRTRMNTNEAAAQTNLKSLYALVEDYRFANGLYPTTANAKTAFTNFVTTYYRKHSIISNLASSGNYWLFQGYRYDYRQLDSASWECIAMPDLPQVTGNRYFIVDSSGRVQEAPTTTTSSTSGDSSPTTSSISYAQTLYPESSPDQAPSSCTPGSRIIACP